MEDLKSCIACPRLATFLRRVRSDHPEYYAHPVASFGDPHAQLLVVGLAPGMHGANRTGRPFTGDFAGILLYETLYRFGFSNRPQSHSVNDDLQLHGCLITNAVKCLPPVNKPNPTEIRQCNSYLAEEISALSSLRVILALGQVAHKAVLLALKLQQRLYPFGHGVRHQVSREIVLFDSYHCSRYNTQTRRLTEDSFHDVFRAIRAEF